MALHSWELQKAIYAHMNGSVTGIGGSGTESLEYAVTVQGGVFYIDGAQTPTLTLKRGSTYKFKQDDASNGFHPVLLSPPQAMERMAAGRNTQTASRIMERRVLRGLTA